MKILSTFSLQLEVWYLLEPQPMQPYKAEKVLMTLLNNKKNYLGLKGKCISITF